MKLCTFPKIRRPRACSRPKCASNAPENQSAPGQGVGGQWWAAISWGVFLELLGGAVAAVSAPILMATYVPDSASDAMSIPKDVDAGAHTHKIPLVMLMSNLKETHCVNPPLGGFGEARPAAATKDEQKTARGAKPRHTFKHSSHN